MFRAFTASIVVLVLAACGGAATPIPTPPVLVQLIDFWQPAAGLLAAGETEGWLFAGQAGDRVRIRALAQGSTVLSLQSADGITLAQGETIEATLPTDGTYTIFIHSPEGGQYELGLGYADRPNPADYTPTPLPATVAVPTPTPPYYADLGTFITEIRSGEPLPGRINAPDERHLYTFEGTVGHYATITARRTSDDFDPLLALYGPDGAQIASDDNSGGDRSAVLRNILLPAGGTFSVIVSGREFTGSYEVVLFSSDQPTPITPTFIPQPSATRIAEVLTPTVAFAAGGDLRDHVPVMGSLDRPGDVNRFVISASAGDLITIGASPAPGSALRPHLEVYDPDGALVATATVGNSNAGGDALVSALQISLTGGYQVFLTGDNNTSGGYIISYGRGVSREEVLRGEAIADQPYSGAVLRRGLRDSWSIYLNAGDVITAAASPDDPLFDPVLELVAPDGSPVATDDNGGGGRAALIGGATAPVSGLYHLRVAASGGFGSGAYTLVWHYVNLAPTATPLPGTVLVMAFEDKIPASTYQFYPFQGRAGQQVRVQVIAADEGFDPVAALVGVDGAVIAEVDDTAGDLNPRFNAELPADGTYNVRVNGYLTGGAFTLTVESLVDAPS